MKKLLLIFLGFVMMLSLVGCNEESDTPLNDEVDTLRVGMDLQYPPFETVDNKNNPIGISVDIALALGEYIDQEVEIINTEFGSLIPALESGEIDIAIASMTIDEKREIKVDFSNPYVFFKIIGLVNTDFASENNITSDTEMSEIMEISSTKFVGLATQVSATIPESFGFDVLEATEKSTAIMEITQGTSDVFLMSAEVVAQAHKANPDTTIIVWSPISNSPIGMAVKEGNSELLAQANEFISKMNEPGGQLDELKEKWDDTIKETLIKHGIEYYLNED